MEVLYQFFQALDHQMRELSFFVNRWLFNFIGKSYFTNELLITGNAEQADGRLIVSDDELARDDFEIVHVHIQGYGY